MNTLPTPCNSTAVPNTDKEWFSQRLLAWHARYGRKDLPWQQEISPYRVWVSEIMLQQTQVTTVIPYYRRFMARFPDITILANSALDEVLQYWSGLGYYARGRNLHKTARMILQDFAGIFPDRMETLQSLPGIGRSTAGAILAIAYNRRHAILDGNVKRVLTRLHAIDGWPGTTAVECALWSLAEAYVPHQDVGHYTQAIMDLGATLCTRTRPHCDACPFTAECLARQQGRIKDIPSPKPRKPLPVRQTRMLVLVNDSGEVLLEKRPPTGIWGGLWSLPECSEETDIDQWSKYNLHNEIKVIDQWPVLRHTFSHFHLDITPLHGKVTATQSIIMDDDQHVWYNPNEKGRHAMAAPVARLLSHLVVTAGEME